jgi:hypothetical protein
VVIFLRPSAANIGVTLDILRLFGHASWLQTNIRKSSALPIHCSDEDRETIQSHLPFRLEHFSGASYHQ